MKLAPATLLEIIAILQEGLLTGTDISEKLRALDLQGTNEGLVPTQEYLESKKKESPENF